MVLGLADAPALLNTHMRLKDAGFPGRQIAQPILSVSYGSLEASTLTLLTGIPVLERL